MIYKDPRAGKFFKGLPHSIEEMHELLAVGIEFSKLGLVKLEAGHPILDFDSLLARLEEQRPSN